MKNSIKIVLFPIILGFISVLPKMTISQEVGDKITDKVTLDQEKEIANDYWKNFSPETVKGIYVTASTALNPRKMKQLIDLVHSTELNAMVIDIKDGEDVYLIPEMEELVQQLIKEKIYPIARQVVFLDNKFGQEHPKYALKNKGGNLWYDRAGNLWLDPASREVWEYNAEISKAAIALGFKEIQFDYIRFPSDGYISSIFYPTWDGQTPKNEVIKSFVEYITKEIKNFSDVPLSIDIFGYTFVVKGDLGIGQYPPDLIDYFDYFSPMVYPSHYSPGNFGFKNPASYPYEVITATLKRGERYFTEGNKKKIRAWIQGFNMGALYNEKKINLEKQALYDFGLRGWLVWNPWNTYDAKAFE